MVYFLSDTHFGHENILKMNRPQFSSIKEMDDLMLNNWIKIVKPEDDIYFLGDLFFRAKYDPEIILKQLTGHIHLILGNHDRDWFNEDYRKYFCEICYATIIMNGSHAVYLCHYVTCGTTGKFMVHGHIHDDYSLRNSYKKVLLESDKFLNACADVNYFKPVTFGQLVKNTKDARNKAIIKYGYEVQNDQDNHEY